MMAIVRNVFAVVLGFGVGAGLNMALVVLGPSVIPPPLGVDVTDAQSLSASMHLFEPRHFLFPFLAHALGTLAGSLTAFLVAASHKSAFAFVIGALFLAGGVAAALMIPAPLWFVLVDLLGAYVPMAWIGARVGRRVEAGAAGKA